MSEIQKIYDQLRNVKNAILSLYGEMEIIRDIIKDLNKQIAANEAEQEKTRGLLQNHLQNKPQMPERSDFPDKARYNAEVEKYNKAFSTWGAERDRIEGLLKSLKAAIPILKKKIEEKNERLRELEAEVAKLKQDAKELMELAYKLAREASPREKASIEAEINSVRNNLVREQEVSRGTATRVKKN